ncbi:MAG TPA: hypothetical protein PLM56_09235 [Cyclobacteriaceae bacterium]|nr:hypothetical protein [Cyclobacteriaceae bacterium]HRF33671.1 hypothetical protein [Cyclobacteriaceae bacterium]
MKFELEFFDEFIQKECRKSKRVSSNSAIPDFNKKRQLIEGEIDRIKKSFRSHLFDVPDESRFELFIQHHQSHIIRLADKVATVIDKEESLSYNDLSKGNTRLDLCKILLQGFEELLNYIEKHFSTYFNQDEKIPDTYAYISSKEFKERLAELNQIFEDRSLDHRLKEIVLFPIIEFSTNPDKGITYRRLIYLKYLVNELVRLANNPEKKNYSKAVFEHLFYLNFNSYHFLTYATERVRHEIENLPTLMLQLEHLSFTHKELSQSQVKPQFSLKPKRSSLKDVFSDWLEAEIQFIEKKRQLTLMIPPGGERMENVNDFKVKTALSVPQLAYSIRLLREAGIITNENQSELIRFFAKFFSSTHYENISAESLKSKYYKFESSAVVHIQGVLTKLMNHSKKDC